MQITVKQLIKANNGSVVAVCSTDYGDIIGTWRGEEPEINQRYLVELNVRQKLVWGVDILTADSHEYRAWIEGDTTSLIVKKEVYDDFKCLTTRFGDHLILLETEGVPIIDALF